MKKTILRLLMILAMFMAPSLAESQTQTPTVTEVGKEARAKLRLTSRESDGKRCPANVYIDIYYANGNIFVSSTVQEEIVSLTIEDVDTGDSETLYSITPGEYVSVMLDTGQYLLTLELSDGRVFCGDMYIE